MECPIKLEGVYSDHPEKKILRDSYIVINDSVRGIARLKPLFWYYFCISFCDQLKDCWISIDAWSEKNQTAEKKKQNENSSKKIGFCVECVCRHLMRWTNSKNCYIWTWPIVSRWIQVHTQMLDIINSFCFVRFSFLSVAFPIIYLCKRRSIHLDWSVSERVCICDGGCCFPPKNCSPFHCFYDSNVDGLWNYVVCI